LIDSQEQATTTKQLENEIGIEAGEGEVEGDGEGEEGEGEGEGKGEGAGKDDSVTAPVCLKNARTTCKRMYEVSTDWNLSSYYPLAYNGVLYNTDSDPSQQQYGFNNEYYYNIEPTNYLQTNPEGDLFYGFKCMKYNGDSANPILYVGGKYRNVSTGEIMSGVFEFNLNEKKIKPILVVTDENSEIFLNLFRQVKPEDVNSCFVHGPGNTNLSNIISYYNLQGQNYARGNNYVIHTIKSYWKYFIVEILLLILIIILLIRFYRKKQN
jgi:hypothetical protein